MAQTSPARKLMRVVPRVKLWTFWTLGHRHLGLRYSGNLLYQCNNFAGGIDAVLALPGQAFRPCIDALIGSSQQQTRGLEHFSATSVRVFGCLGYAAAVLAILYWDQVDSIGVGLGIVMMAMIGLFLAAAMTVGFSMRLGSKGRLSVHRCHQKAEVGAAVGLSAPYAAHVPSCGRGRAMRDGAEDAGFQELGHLSGAESRRFHACSPPSRPQTAPKRHRKGPSRPRGHHGHRLQHLPLRHHGRGQELERLPPRHRLLHAVDAGRLRAHHGGGQRQCEAGGGLRCGEEVAKMVYKGFTRVFSTVLTWFSNVFDGFNWFSIVFMV